MKIVIDTDDVMTLVKITGVCLLCMMPGMILIANNVHDLIAFFTSFFGGIVYMVFLHRLDEKMKVKKEVEDAKNET